MAAYMIVCVFRERMKKMKKLFSMLLALALVAALGVPAFATEGGESTVPKPVITKQPTGETVDEGGSAVFVARAENYTEIVWRIVSNDTTNTVQAADAPTYFGCSVTGLGTERLEIFNIPASMDGWRVEAMFKGPGGIEYSWGALIRVNGVTVKAPSISAQPQPLSLASGETGTLTVGAAGLEGKTQYQWYSNTANSNEGGKAIEGATDASYTPAEITGTTYYYVSVTSVYNGRSSDAVLSNPVAVTYAPPPGEELPEPEATAVPVTPAPLVPVVDIPEDEPGSTPEATQDPARSASSPEERADNSLRMLTLVGGALAVAAIIGGITALVVRARSGDDDEDDEDDYE